MKPEQQAMMEEIAKLTASARFVRTEDIEFLRSDSRIRDSLDAISKTLLDKINDVFQYVAPSDHKMFKSIDDLDNFEEAGDVIDSLFEKVDIMFDNENKKEIKVQKLEYFGEQSSTSSSKKMTKPQLKFKDKIDNSESLWVPIIKKKPNAMKPINLTADLSPEMRNHIENLSQAVAAQLQHPYEYEIQNISYPPSMFVHSEPYTYNPIEKTPAQWVDNIESFKSMCKILEKADIMAVDLEHHDYRSYLGFTCLMQISTVENDYLVDTLALREEISDLNNVFTNPNKVKVFHGADMDIQWLQRDFGVYVVNLFDTFHASHVLEMEKHSLAAILEFYCNIVLDKKHQRSDWRIRPLPQGMLKYAQSDTHYLLHIYSRMKNELLDNDGMQEVLDRSAMVSLKRYEKPIYDVEGEKNSGWKSTIRKSMDILNDNNISVLKAIHRWRDNIARIEDESPRFVVPEHILTTLARIMPVTAKDVLATCIPTPPLVRIYAKEIAQTISNSMTDITNLKLTDEIVKEEDLPAVEKNILVQPVLSLGAVDQSQFFGNILDEENTDALDLEWILHPVCATVDSAQAVRVPKRKSMVMTVRDTLVGLKRKRQEAVEETEVNTVSTTSSEKPEQVENTPEKRPIKKIKNFKPFDYSKEVQPKESKAQSAHFDPMSQALDTKEKQIKSRTHRKPKSISYKKSK